MPNPNDDEDDFSLDLGDMSIEDLMADANDLEQDANVAQLNAARENNPHDFSTLAREYAKLRPDPTLDYTILDECGVAGYDVFFFGQASTDIRLITEAFLTHVKDDFYAKGIGTYDCIWRMRDGLGHFDEERVKRAATAWRKNVCRIRDELHPADRSIFTVVRSQILPDQKHVAVSLGRMTNKIYQALDARRRQQGMHRVNFLARVKSLL